MNAFTTESIGPANRLLGKAKRLVLAAAAVITLWGATPALAQPWVGSANPMATFYKEKGWPAWSDAIRWNNRINMATYTNGANDFEKFENARDQLASQGGGVLYYPAGTYSFADHPTGPNTGRGLMLKSGVVILGDEPSTDKLAIVDSATAGLNALGTKFIFPMVQKAAFGGGIGLVPEPWNMIGLYADAQTRVSDVHHVGLAWVNVVGGYVYFGPDLDWASTWGELNPQTSAGSYRKARWSKAPNETVAWNERIPNGTFPGDPMFGAVRDGQYRHGIGGRFIFGCRFDDCALTDTYMELYKSAGGVRTDSVDAETFHTYRFASRLNLDGANIFVANNALPKSDKNFYYDQKIQRHGQVVSGSPFQVKTILFDYGKQGGIDINKALITRAANRCNYLNGPYAEENVMVRDNWVYSHGHKAYELAGKWMVVQNNVNYRDYLTEGDNVYGLPSTGLSPGYELTLDGVQEAGVNSDNMSRSFDMAGWCVWTDHNWYTGTGSFPGNDGEGILYQTQGGVGFLSVAETFNRQGRTGKNGYIAPWDVVVYGMFQGWNQQRGAVGLLKPDANRVEDAFAIENYHPVTGNPSSTAGLNGTNIADLTFTCPTGAVAPPINVVVTPDTVRTCIVVDWEDVANNEVAFRVDRRVVQSPDWVTIAYRPANVTGSLVQNFRILDLGQVPSGCDNQGTLDLNPQQWVDYNAVPGEAYEYRVVAINCANDDQGASPVTPTVTFPVSVPKASTKLGVKLSPNPAITQLIVQLSKLDGNTQALVQDVNGRPVISTSLTDLKGSIDVSSLIPGVYNLQLTQGASRTVVRFVKQ